MGRPRKDADQEIQAIELLMGKLAPLPPDARARVLNYVWSRFSEPLLPLVPAPEAPPLRES